MIFFFFSSRRRHTRCGRDWSSDVCSSDLVPLLASMLAQGIDGHRFDFYVVSAAPQEVVLAALDGIVPPDHVVGTQFGWDARSGRIASIQRVAAGFGKVAAVEERRLQLALPRDQVLYVGDGQSDI